MIRIYMVVEVGFNMQNNVDFAAVFWLMIFGYDMQNNVDFDAPTGSWDDVRILLICAKYIVLYTCVRE